MKAVLLACLVAAAPLAFAAGTRPKPTDPPSTTSGGDEAFHANIEPLLLTRCSPCHAPGGRMYAKMPFDQPAIVRSHAPGVLKRLKGGDRETVQAWLDAR